MTRKDIDDIISILCPNDEDYEKPIISPKYLRQELEQLALEQVPCEDAISRQVALDGLASIAKAKAKSDAQKSLMGRVMFFTEHLPSAQPEQRYTEEELRVFAHGISLSLLSKRSAQHWRYDKDTATEIEFLERLYDKVSVDMKGGQG